MSVLAMIARRRRGATKADRQCQPFICRMRICWRLVQAKHFLSTSPHSGSLLRPYSSGSQAAMSCALPLRFQRWWYGAGFVVAVERRVSPQLSHTKCVTSSIHSCCCCLSGANHRDASAPEKYGPGPGIDWDRGCLGCAVRAGVAAFKPNQRTHASCLKGQRSS
jgi:hypothetical protein